MYRLRTTGPGTGYPNARPLTSLRQLFLRVSSKFLNFFSDSRRVSFKARFTTQRPAPNSSGEQFSVAMAKVAAPLTL